MVEMTDPARELAELCDQLRIDTASPGELFLSQQFNVEPWSFEFFQILFCIANRVNQLISIIESMQLDADIKHDAQDHLRQILTAFSQSSMQHAWKSVGITKISRENVQPIKMLRV